MSRPAGIEVPWGKFRLAVGFVLFLGVLLFLNYGVTKLTDLLAFQMYPSNLNIAIFIVFSSATLYVVLMALPFMPGMLVGLMLMAMLGGGGIVLVYLCTVLALSLSFLTEGCEALLPHSHPEPCCGPHHLTLHGTGIDGISIWTCISPEGSP